MNNTETFYAPTGGFRLPIVHPGEILEEALETRGLTAHAFALAIRVPANRISEIIRAKRGISAETALRIGRFLGTGARFWLNLQISYDLLIAERDKGALIETEVPAAA